MRKLKYTLVITLLFIAGISKSQNTGPVAPEAVAFEPVDATDMVNLVTGDFTYVIPLLNVPSPEGGYPIALSYHGGVTMDQEASWVGLGWNVNPGAINRKINGFPDDWKAAERITQINLIGEDYEVQTVGVGVHLGNKGVLSVGVAYSWGDYKGFDGEIGLGFGSTNFNIGVQASTRSGFSLSAGNGYNSIGTSVSINQSGDFSVGLSNNASRSSIGVNFDSEGQIGVGFSIAGARSYLGKFNTLDSKGFSSYENSFGISVPIYMFYLSYDTYSAGWSYFSKEYDFCYGSLYTFNARNQMDENDGMRHYYDGVQDCDDLMDSYEIPYDSEAFFKKESLVKSNNLMFAAYDDYVVSGQGISGRFSPQLFSETLLTGDSYALDKEKTDQVYYRNWSKAMNNTHNIYPEFYFKNEYIGYLHEEPGTFSKNELDEIDYLNEYRETNLTINSEDYNGYVNHRKVSGNYIQYFTNKEVNNGTAKLKGFLENDYCSDRRANEAWYDPDGIAGFMITTTNGQTYHYTLPVYQLEEFLRKNEKTTYDYFEQLNTNSYAYTWLLTAITGPDYIDKTNDGITDDDYGYWMKFNYEKYTDGYRWQFPYDLEGETYLTYVGEIQSGSKQIFYLNSIESRTHKALFIKKKRLDGLSSALEHYEHTSTIRSEGRRDISTGLIVGFDENRDYIRSQTRTFGGDSSFSPLALSKIILVRKNDIQNIEVTSNESDVLIGSITQSISDENIRIWNEGEAIPDDYIYLAENEWLNVLTGDIVSSSSSPASEGTPDNSVYVGSRDREYHIYKGNLYLEEDVDMQSLLSKATKVIEFDYDYSLCKNTPNSASTEQAKLALKKVDIKGNKGSKVIPSYIFEYNKLGSNSFYEDNKDKWGYDQNHPENWSLSRITLPTGASLEVDYEQNKFKNEAVYGYKIPFISNHFDRNDLRWKVEIPCDMESLELQKDYRIKGTMFLAYSIYEHDPDYPYYDGWVITGDKTITQSIDCYLRLDEIDEENNCIYFAHEQCFPNIGNYLNNDEQRLDEIYFKEGFIAVSEDFEQRGGGVRVSRIDLTTANQTVSTIYDYKLPESDYTSGKIMYSVYNIKNKYIPYATELPVPKVLYKFVTVRNVENDNTALSKLYEFEVYKNVKTEGVNFGIDGQFEVENKQLPTECLYQTEGEHINKNYGRSTIIKDNLFSLGRLISVSVLNNNSETLNREVYEYVDPDSITLGLNQETYNYMKVFLDYSSDFQTSNNIVHYNATSRITYPSVLRSKITYANGIVYKNDFIEHDFYSGNVLQTETTLTNGNILKSEVLPAYQVEGFYDEMGPMALNENNKNMLSQQAASLTYLNDEPIGVSIQTWNDTWNYRDYNESNNNYVETEQSDVWRKHKQFVWKGDMNTDGTYGANFGSYDTPDKLVANWSEFNEGSTNKWEKVNEITRYNHYSAPLESMDIDSNYASARMDIHSERTIASAANASYRQFTYTGFEQEVVRDTRKDFGGEVFGISNKNIRICSENASSYVYVDNSGYTQIAEMNSHTGDFFVKVTGNSVSSTNTGGPEIVILNESPEARKFMASVWVHMNSVAAKLSIESGSPVYMDSQEFPQFGSWVLMSYVFEIPGTTDQQTYAETVYIDCEGSGNIAYFDDFRVHPIDAPMQSYVYDKHTGAVTAILDNNNIATKYEYDDAGKLKTVLKEVPGVGTEGGFKPVSRHNYGYARATDQVFSIVSDIVEATGVNPYTQQRNVSVSFTLRNNDLIEQDCNLTLSLEDYGDKTISTTLGPKSTVDVTANWDVDNGSSMVKQLTISGDVEQQENISIDVVPEELSIINFEAINQGDGSYRLKVKFKNVGGSTGSWPDLKWDHYGVESTDFTETVTLVAGQSSVEYYSDYYYLEDGSHTFRILDGDSMVWGNPQIITIDVGGTGY